MANLNANFENFVAHVSKHGFDVGKDNFFTAAPGMILPIWKDILNAGERLHFTCDDIVRTLPMMKPASLHVRQKVDLFFVPASMIYTAFGNTLFQTNDLISSLYSVCDDEYSQQWKYNEGYLPVCNMGSYETVSAFNSHYNEGFEAVGKEKFRLAMHLGYNPFASISEVHYDDDGDTYYVSPLNFNPSVFPWAAATYQAIYQNWYRNDDWELRDVKSYNLDYLLYDDSAQLNDFLTLRYHQRVGDYFSSIKRSPVMSTLNLSLGGFNGNDEDSVRVLSQVKNYLATGFDDERASDTSGSIDYAVSDKNFASILSSDDIIPVTPAGLRSLFSVEKYLRISGRAAKNYDSQVLAHFGVNVPRDIKHEISFLGGFDGYIDSKQIIATAGTENTELGEQAGYGEGQLGGKTIKFTAPCHGFVMAVYYVVPEFSYPQGLVFDKLNSITNRLDFFFPEYDKLGKQPMFAYECFPLINDTPERDYKTYIIDGESYISSNRSSTIVGWQYRYEHFKRQYNIHSLAFYRPYTDYSTDNDWASWIIGKNPFDIFELSESDINVNYKSLLVTPHDLDRIFVQQFAGGVTAADLESPWLMFQTDPIMVAMKINAKKTSGMSPTGEPDLF